MGYFKGDGKFHTFEELEKLYPDMWVLLTDYKATEGLKPISGVLFEYGDKECVSDRRYDFMCEHPNTPYIMAWTNPIAVPYFIGGRH